MSLYEVARFITGIVYWVGVFAGAACLFGVAFALIKKPLKKLREIIKETLKVELEPIVERLDELADDVAEMKYCEILVFMRKVQAGENPSDLDWTYIMRYVDEYLDSDRNGVIKSASKYLKVEFAKR